MITLEIEKKLLKEGYILSPSRPYGEKVYFNWDRNSRVHITLNSFLYYHEWWGITRTSTTWSYGLYRRFTTFNEFKQMETESISTSPNIIYHEQFKPFGY